MLFQLSWYFLLPLSTEAGFWVAQHPCHATHTVHLKSTFLFIVHFQLSWSSLLSLSAQGCFLSCTSTVLRNTQFLFEIDFFVSLCVFSSAGTFPCHFQRKVGLWVSQNSCRATHTVYLKPTLLLIMHFQLSWSIPLPTNTVNETKAWGNPLVRRTSPHFEMPFRICSTIV